MSATPSRSNFYSMSQDHFTEIFSLFREKFPPVENIQQASLTLTTEEIIETFHSFNPDMEFPSTSLYSFMKAQSYVFLPQEKNERIVFYWLIGQRG